MRVPLPFPLVGAIIAATIATSPVLAQDPAPLGLFEGHSDVGMVLHAGAANYDESQRTYTVSGSGENMWFASDAFHFVWKRVSGDASLTADIVFPQKGGNTHRKAVLMVRQSLDAGSAYADAALHGDGLTSLQARTEQGATTHEVQANASAPRRLRIMKRGDQVYIFVAGEGDPLRFAGGSMRLDLKEPYYIGIGVCSHEKDTVETAVFSNVELTSGAPASAERPALYSTLETVTVASTDARAVYAAPGRIEAPTWTPDGSSLLFTRAGRIERLPAAGGQPQPIQTGAEFHSSRYHAISPDGQLIAYSDEPKKKGKETIFVTPFAGGATRRVTSHRPSWGPAWSPDGKKIVFTGARSKQIGVYTIAASGGAETPLITGQARNEAPEFSPDGKFIYFTSDRSGSRQIWRARADGSAPEQLTNDDSNNAYAHVSPDGKRLVFLSYAKNAGEPKDQPVLLRTMTLSDGKISFLASFTGGTGSFEAPSWSSDGKRVAFVSYQMLP